MNRRRKVRILIALPFQRLAGPHIVCRKGHLNPAEPVSCYRVYPRPVRCIAPMNPAYVAARLLHPSLIFRFVCSSRRSHDGDAAERRRPILRDRGTMLPYM